MDALRNIAKSSFSRLLREIRWGTAFVAVLVATGALPAAVEVNPAEPICHQVVIQPIRTKKSDGSTATFFGNAASEAYIKEQIDAVWAQSGIVISWLPVVDYENDFAYDGSPGDYSNKARSTFHLNEIVDDAPSPPRDPNATVISMFFVEICPGFEQVGDNYANGLAWVDSNGITIHVGANLVDWNGGRDVIAAVAAHEIGHNLGLPHTSSGGDNLMSPGGTSERITGSQTGAVFTNNGGIDGYDMVSPYALPSNYELWATAAGLAGGPADDDDGDGVINVLEFMLGLDGNTRDSGNMPNPVWSPAGLTWTLPKNSDALDDGLVYAIEVGTDTSSWNPAGTAGTASTVISDTSSELVVRLNPGEAASFMRITVDIPPALEADIQGFVPLEVLDMLNPTAERQISSCASTGCGCRHAEE